MPPIIFVSWAQQTNEQRCFYRTLTYGLESLLQPFLGKALPGGVLPAKGSQRTHQGT